MVPMRTPSRRWGTASLRLLFKLTLEASIVALLLLLAPVLLGVLGLLFLLPLLDWALHPEREYLDGLSSTWFRFCPHGVVHVVVTAPRKPAEEIIAQFHDTYLKPGVPHGRRLHQRIVARRWRWSYWQRAEGLREDYHFNIHAEPLTKAGLEQTIGEFLSTPLDMGRPLWQLRIFTALEDEDGQPACAAVLRMHHAMADGLSILHFMYKGFAPMELPKGTPSQRSRRRRPSLWYFIRTFVWALWKLLFMQADRRSALRAARRFVPWGPAAVAWNPVRAASVHGLKSIGQALGQASLNDVLLTALARALGRYAQEGMPSQTDVPEKFTAALWVSPKPIHAMHKDFTELPVRWGNLSLCVCYLSLALGGKCDRETSLREVHALTTNPALMVEAGVARALLVLIGLLPWPLGWLIWQFSDKVSVSVSNVPGPAFPAVWLGMEVRRVTFFVPPTGSISLFVTIFSFNGEATVGICGNAATIDQEALRQITGKFFDVEIHGLKDWAGVDSGVGPLR